MRFSLDTQELESEEACETQAKTMIDQLEKSGTLQSIIDQAHQETARLPADLGRGGNQGLVTFLEVTKGNVEDAEGDEEKPSFRSSMSTLLHSDEDLRSALEEQLVRRFPLQLVWNRKEGGPTVIRWQML